MKEEVCDGAPAFGRLDGVFSLLTSCILRQRDLLMLLARVEIAHFRATREGRHYF